MVRAHFRLSFFGLIFDLNSSYMLYFIYRVIVLFLLHVPALVLLRKLAYCNRADCFNPDSVRVILDFAVIVIPVILLVTVWSEIHHFSFPLVMLFDAALLIQRSNCIWHVMAAQLTYNATIRTSSLQYIPHGTLALQIMWNQLCEKESEGEHPPTRPIPAPPPEPQTAVTKSQLLGGDALPNIRSSMVSVFKGGNMILTCISILAVDFVIYPRYFAKTESFGCSLMDLGVGTFIVGSAITSRFSRGIGDCVANNISNGNDANNATSTFTSSSGAWTLRSLNLFSAHSTQRLMILLLGVGRFICLRMLNYQVHVGEYGAHWNFFVTLFAVWTIADICDWLFGRLTQNLIRSRSQSIVNIILTKCFSEYKWFLCVSVVCVYQALLLAPCYSYVPTSAMKTLIGSDGASSADQTTAMTLSMYMLDNSAAREDLLSANKEGFFSVLGYLGLYWASELFARNVIYAPFAHFVVLSDNNTASESKIKESVSVFGNRDDTDNSVSDIGSDVRPPNLMTDSLIERRFRSTVKGDYGNGDGIIRDGASSLSAADQDTTAKPGNVSVFTTPVACQTPVTLHVSEMHLTMEESVHASPAGVKHRGAGIGSGSNVKPPTIAVQSIDIVAPEVYHFTSQQLVTRLLSLSALTLIAFTVVSTAVQQPSRRLCNVSYLLYVLFITVFNMLLCHLVDNLVVIDSSFCNLAAVTDSIPNGLNSPISRPGRDVGSDGGGSGAPITVLAHPHAHTHIHSIYHRSIIKEILVNNKITLFELMNKHQLYCFLIANVLTGAVNQSMQTIYCSTEVALTVLIGYMGILTVCMCILNQRRH